MAKRKEISSSLRWSVYARDGFTCRYCGARAGQDGVELAVDHVLSVKDGGDNSYDNLVTACRGCNGGKGARSLKNAPTAAEVIDRIDKQTASLQAQAEAMNAAIQAQKELEQMAVNLKCHAYQVNRVDIERSEISRIIRWCKQYGSDFVVALYRQAHDRGVSEYKAVRYVQTCISNMEASE